MLHWKAKILLFAAFSLLAHVDATVKFTNVYCEWVNKTLGYFNKCEIKAMSRRAIVLNISAKFLQPLTKVDFHIEWFKKANGYKPWLYNYTFSYCTFLKKRSHPIFSFMYRIVEENIFISNECPLKDGFSVRALRLDEAKYSLPFPNGDYRFDVYMLEISKLFALAKFYFRFE